MHEHRDEHMGVITNIYMIWFSSFIKRNLFLLASNSWRSELICVIIYESLENSQGFRYFRESCQPDFLNNVNLIV